MQYEEILLESEIVGLTKLLGQGGAQAVSYELQLGKPEMSPAEFHERLFFLFRGGTTVLERAIIQEFYRRLGLPFKGRSPLIFEEYVNEAIALKSDTNREISRRPGI